MIKRLIASFMFIMFLISPVLAHPGRLDKNGGHTDHKTGQYHYHNPDGTITTSPPSTKPVTAAPIIVYIDSVKLSMDVAPTVESGRTLVPLRAIFEALGAEVTYDSTTKTITATKEGTIISLPIGKATSRVNNQDKKLDVPAKIVQGRTLVPIRFVSEALGAEVKWDGKTRTISIVSAALPVSTTNPTPLPPNSSASGSEPTVVYAINVGQADSLLITSRKSSMLIDGGNNADGKAVVDFIKRHGVTSLDVIIATHPDEDHIGGLDDVINNIPVKKVIESKQTATTDTFKSFAQSIKNHNVPVEYPNNQKFNVGNAQTEILGPIKDYKDVNDDSVVCRVVVGSISFLFTGDMEAEAEKDILNKLGPTTVLKVGHHGSITSTSQEMLDKVDPNVAIISVGVNNKYHHPAPSTVDRVKKSGAAVYETDKNGMVYIWTDGKTYKVVTENAA